jgi:AraC-like DNA-binding protein
MPHYLIKNESQHFIGIQLQPFALKYLFGIPNKEFTNRVIDGFMLCKSLANLFDELASVLHFEQRVDLILKWFRQKLRSNYRYSDKCLIFDLCSINAIENQSVKSISKTYNLSERHLRRLSNDYLGMNTEDFILYRKYLKSLLQLHDTQKSLTEIAYESEFYDQSHFIREFKAFTGLTPGEYRKNISGLPGHLFFPAKCPSGTIYSENGNSS